MSKVSFLTPFFFICMISLRPLWMVWICTCHKKAGPLDTLDSFINSKLWSRPLKVKKKNSEHIFLSYCQNFFFLTENYKVTTVFWLLTSSNIRLIASFYAVHRKLLSWTPLGPSANNKSTIYLRMYLTELLFFDKRKLKWLNMALLIRNV